MLVVGLAGESSTRLEDLSLDRPTAIVVGAEGSGLRKGVRDACELLARLPTAPPLDTLNASVSAAIALYEVRRQRMAHDHAAATPV
jgi:23S rRNA (guanosine2251-2'-O)-methyltransferase